MFCTCLSKLFCLGKKKPDTKKAGVFMTVQLYHSQCWDVCVIFMKISQFLYDCSGLFYKPGHGTLWPLFYEKKAGNSALNYTLFTVLSVTLKCEG